MRANGAGAGLTVLENNFTSEGTGGDGGAGQLGFGSFELAAPSGGNGGNGRGGAIETVADEGATITLGLASGNSVLLSSLGRGGAGGAGSDSAFDAEAQAGNGGNGGTGTGGTVRLLANGGTITSNGENVDIDASGVSGETGLGGIGRGGGADGADGTFGDTRGGRVAIEALNGLDGPGQIALGLTNITASGDAAGRIELRAQGNLSFAGLDATAFGTAAPTNNDTNVAPAGIFAALDGGSITSEGDVTLTTDSSVGVYAQSDGIFDVNGSLTIDAGDQIDVRHDLREGAAPTIRAGDSLTATALNSISGAPGSTLAAGDILSLATTGAAGSIGVDRLEGGNITISSDGAASVEHAEATDDFTATAGSFRTGLNSIITGGDIVLTSPGAIDLGNSTAGGFVQVSGQSIAFNTINAGLSVGLSAEGMTAGAEGISGGSIAAGGNINLFGNSIALSGTVTGDMSFFAFSNGGAVSVNDAAVAGTISIFSAADLAGTYVAGGDIFLNSGGNITASARASGGYVDGNGISTEGNLFVVAAGDAALTDSSAARMFGVSAELAASVDGGTAGEDILVIAGTTASLTGVTAGDDVTVRAPGNITAVDVSTTGAGADTHILGFSADSSSSSPTFIISAGEGTDGINGADIVMASAAGAIDAAMLSAGDDILLNAANSIAVNGATTLGLGTTGGDSSIRTQGGTTTLAGLDAFSDIAVEAAGLANLTGTVAAGRNATINAQNVTLAALTGSGGNAVPALSADGTVTVNSSAGITGGGIRALGDATLTAGTAIDVTGVEGNNVALAGTTGVAADAVNALGTISLDSSDGDIRLGSLFASGTISASADAIRIEGGGDMQFTTLTTEVGDAYIRSSGDFSVAAGNIAGTADLATQGEAMTIGNLTAANAILENSGGFLNLDTVAVAGNLRATARASLGISGVITGQSIALASADIAIGSAARVGTAGVTQQVSVANNNDDNQTFVGGAPTANVAGYHIDADELTRLYGTGIEIFAPEVQAVSVTSVGSAAPPDMIVDGFTMTGGGSNSNLGANGTLTLRTPGKMRVIGDVRLTGLTDANGLTLAADDALEIILGSGTVRLLGDGDAPGGRLDLISDDVIVATEAAIAAVGNAATIDAINARLAQNDGVVLDEGALFARGIRAQVAGGFYVQNSGAGSDFGERRGLSFGEGGLTVVTTGQPRIVVNGVYLGPNGQVTGFDVLPTLSIVQASGAAGGFNSRSTLNGCLIANPTACTTVAVDAGTNFPVQDVIEEEADSDGEGEGNNLPTPLITMRDLDPLSGEPLVDDPVTGAGNDDLWTTPGD
ncbi:MAG TPA: hypothetical protein VN047_15225 [Sphingopyxis sp.]|nr:hypothetical protein [Sphingopyxis sp.]